MINLIKTSEMIDTMCVNHIAIGNILDYSIDINHDDRKIDVYIMESSSPISRIRCVININKEKYK